MTAFWQFIKLVIFICKGSFKLDSMQNKQKVTIYIPSEIHKRLKIRAATDEESMSFIVEKAVNFYLKHSTKVKKLENLDCGKIHQVHFCPECKAAVVVDDRQIFSLKNQSDIVQDNFSLNAREKKPLNTSISDKETFVFY